MTAVRLSYFTGGFVSEFSLWKKGAQDSCVNMTMKYSEIGRERHRLEDTHNERRSGDHLILLPSAPLPNLFLEGSTLSGYFLCYMCRKQIIHIRFANITNPAANSSSVLCSLSSRRCHYIPSLLSLSVTIFLSLGLIFTSHVLLFCFSTHMFSCCSPTQHYLFHWTLI